MEREFRTRKVQIYCSGEQYAQLSEDPRFWTAVTLSRVVNALRNSLFILHRAETRHVWEPNPNDLFYLAGNLFEAIQYAGRLGRNCRTLAAFASLHDFLQSKEVKEFSAKVLKPLRNKVVFHFDDDVTQKAALQFPWPNFVLRERLDILGAIPYYPFGDFAILYSVVAGDCDSASAKARIEEYMDRTLKYVVQLLGVADALLEELFQVLGLRSAKSLKATNGKNLSRGRQYAQPEDSNVHTALPLKPIASLTKR